MHGISTNQPMRTLAGAAAVRSRWEGRPCTVRLLTYVPGGIMGTAGPQVSKHSAC